MLIPTRNTDSPYLIELYPITSMLIARYQKRIYRPNHRMLSHVTIKSCDTRNTVLSKESPPSFSFFGTITHSSVRTVRQEATPSASQWYQARVNSHYHRIQRMLQM